jgi:hypothetical protein
MLVDGIILLVISLCYLAAGVAISLIFFYLGPPLIALVGMMVVFLGFFLLPLALVHAFRTENSSKAFAIGEIAARIRIIGIIDYFLFVLIIFILPLLLMGILVLIPFLGWFIGFLAVPVIGIFIARASAMAYGL